MEAGNQWKMNRAKAVSWNVGPWERYAAIKTEPLYRRQKGYWLLLLLLLLLLKSYTEYNMSEHTMYSTIIVQIL